VAENEVVVVGVSDVVVGVGGGDGFFAGDVAIEDLSDVGVIADDDEDGRGLVLVGGGGLDVFEAFGPLTGKGAQGGFGLLIDGIGLGPFGLAGQAAAGADALVDELPETEVGGFGAAGGVGDGQARDLDDAGFDGVDEAEIGDEPGEWAAFLVTGAGDVERGGGEVDAEADARGLVDAVESLDPNGRFFAVGLDGLGFLAGEFFLEWGGTVGVVALVVEDQDGGVVVEVAEDATSEGVRALLALVDDGVGLAAFDVFAFLGELVPVEDGDLAGAEKGTEGHGDEVEGLVVVVGIVRAEDLEALLDGEIGAADEDGGGEALVGGVAAAVAERPGDEHGHDDGLAGAGGHLAAEAGEGTEVVIGREVFEVDEVDVGGLGIEARPATTETDLGEMDDGLDGFELAEEEAAGAVVAPPPAEEFFGDGGGAFVAALAPALDVGAEAVDEVEVLAVLLGEERHGELAGAGGFGADVVTGGAATGLLAGLAGDLIVLPVGSGLGVGGTEDRAVDGLDGEGFLTGLDGWVRHGWAPNESGL
jgi:hypothetical protein